MVKALINGERSGSLVQVLVLVTSLLAAGAAIVLALSYRSAWHHSQNGEYQLCVQREAYDRANHQLEQTDADLQRADIETFTVYLPTGALKSKLIASHENKLTKDEAYLATPVVDGCELVKP